MQTLLPALIGLCLATSRPLLAAAATASPGARSILVVDNSAGNDVSLIDTATNRVIGSIETGAAPHGLGASPDGTRLYVTSEGEDRILAFDLTTATLLWERPVSGRANEIAVTADGRFIYVPIRSADYVEVIDTELRRTIGSITVGPSPHNAYRAPQGKWIYATSMGGASVAIIDIATQAVVATIPVGGVPRPAVMSRDERLLYVQLTGLHGFVVADVAARKVVSRVELPPADVSRVSTYGYTPSHGIALRPDGRQLWITDVYGGHAEGFSLPEHTLIATVKTGDASDWLEFSSDGRWLYVGNAGSNDVSVVDTEQRREVARVPVGLGPKRLLAVQVPRGMGGPGEPGWDRAAARPATTDYHLKGAGLISCTTGSFQDKFAAGEIAAESVPALYRKLGVLGVELEARHVRSWDRATLDRIVGALQREKRILTALDVAAHLVSEDDEANQRQIAECRRLMWAARHLGAPTVVLALGKTGAGDRADSGQGVERAIVALRQLVPLAKQLGLRLAIENAPGPAMSADAILRMIQSTDPAWVGVCFNFGQWKDPAALRSAIEKLRPHVFHTHVAGMGFDRFGNDNSIDYAYALPAMAQGGFGGALSIRYQGRGEPERGVAGLRDLLVKLWISKRTAVAIGKPLPGPTP
ncbi:MAG: TIM barrel protein [Verrucomicrobia bacterium]|nr:TIM barrel protein [Verrucomicrobiota bacterium]